MIRHRSTDLPRIVDEYVFDAIVELAPTRQHLVLSEPDRQWLIEQAATMACGRRTERSPAFVGTFSTRRVITCTSWKQPWKQLSTSSNLVSAAHNRQQPQGSKIASFLNVRAAGLEPARG